MVSTPYELLRTELKRDGTRPFITFYDDATGERVELSVTTFDNWVAKTAGLLRDDLSADAGHRVALLLPPHWQTLVWAAACWALGACVTTNPDDADVVVTGPDGLADVDTAVVPDVVALSLRPLGGRFTTPLPAGVLDYAVEVPGHPDQLIPYAPPDISEPALANGDALHTLAGVVELAQGCAKQLGAEPGARLLVAPDGLRSALVDALLVPLVVGGSAVLVRNEQHDGRAARATAERVTLIP